MKSKKLIISILLSTGLGLKVLFAQHSIAASGGIASGSGGNVSYTIGQITYTENTNTSGSVSQGIQQPFIITDVTGIEEAKGISLLCSVFPNPAVDNLTLKIEDEIQGIYTVHLLDLSGKVLEISKAESGETRIDMNKLDQGIYFLKISINGKELKIFKIIKTQ